MAVNLSKGGKVNLTKESGSTLNIAMMEATWKDRGAASGEDFDLDVFAIVLGANGKVRKETDFIFFNQLVTDDGEQRKVGSKFEVVKEGFVTHMGDNLTGADAGMDGEKCKLNFPNFPSDAVKVVIGINIHQGPNGDRGHKFGMVEDAVLRVKNGESNETIATCELDFDFADATGFIPGSFTLRNGEWWYSNEQKSFEGGLESICSEYGVQ